MTRALPPSYFRLAAIDVPEFPPLDGSRRADVCVVGGGYTGLSAALHLAEAGADVVLVEADRVAERRIRTQRRPDPFGPAARRALAGGALRLRARQGAVGHRRGGEGAGAGARSSASPSPATCGPASSRRCTSPLWFATAARLVEALNSRYGYDRASLLDRAETVAALGSERFSGAMLDRGGGHLDPYRFAARPGAGGYGPRRRASTRTRRPLRWRDDGGPLVRTSRGDIRAGHVIIATDGRSGALRAGHAPPHGRHQQLRRGDRAARRGRRSDPSGRGIGGRQPLRRALLAQDAPTDGWSSAAARAMPAAFPPMSRAFVRPHLDEVYPQLSGVPVSACLGRDRLGHRAATALRARDRAGDLGGRRLFGAGGRAGALRRQASRGGNWRAHGADFGADLASHPATAGCDVASPRTCYAGYISRAPRRSAVVAGQESVYLIAGRVGG